LPEHHLDDFAVGLAFRFHHGVAVDVHGGGDLRVPHELLLHAYRRANQVQPRPIGMSKGVPPDVPQTQLAAGRTDVILLDWAGMVTASGDHAGENPVFLRLGTLPFPVQQNGSEIGIEREIILRILGLDLIDYAVHYCASDSHREIGEVDIRPLQRQDFANTKSQALRDNHHGAVGFQKELENRDILKKSLRPRENEVSNLTIEFTWIVSSRLHVGSGLSRLGYADRCLQVDDKGIVRYTGDAVKGAIRQSAEAVLRWLIPGVPEEDNEDSAPPPGVLRRIFQSRESGKYWRFEMPEIERLSGMATTYSSTAINSQSGVAMTDTLRTKETWDRGARVHGRITGFNINPHTNWADAMLLIAAIASTEQIGGSRGTGLGEVLLESINVSPPEAFDLNALGNPETIQRLQDLLHVDQQTAATSKDGVTK